MTRNNKGLRRFLALLMAALMVLGMCSFGYAADVLEDVDVDESVTESVDVLPQEEQDEVKSNKTKDVEEVEQKATTTSVKWTLQNVTVNNPPSTINRNTRYEFTARAVTGYVIKNVNVRRDNNRSVEIYPQYNQDKSEVKFSFKCENWNKVYIVITAERSYGSGSYENKYDEKYIDHIDVRAAGTRTIVLRDKITNQVIDTIEEQRVNITAVDRAIVTYMDGTRETFTGFEHKNPNSTGDTNEFRKENAWNKKTLKAGFVSGVSFELSINGVPSSIVINRTNDDNDPIREAVKACPDKSGLDFDISDTATIYQSVTTRPGTLVVTKNFSGIDALPNDFAIDVKCGNETVETLTTGTEGVRYDPNTKTYTWNVSITQAGTYTVEEKGYTQSGYNCTTTGTGANNSKTFEAVKNNSSTTQNQIYDMLCNGVASATIAITNTYTRVVNVTFNKDNGTLPEGMTSAPDATIIYGEGDNDRITFSASTLSSTLNGIIPGTQITFTENTPTYDTDTYDWSVSVKLGDTVIDQNDDGSFTINVPNNDCVVTITNTYTKIEEEPTTGTVTINKVFENVDPIPTAGTITFTLTNKDTNADVQPKTVVVSYVNGAWTGSADDVPFGTYTISESDFEITGYTHTGTSYKVDNNIVEEITISENNASVTINATNTYTKKEEEPTTGHLAILKEFYCGNDKLNPTEGSVKFTLTSVDDETKTETLELTYNDDTTNSWLGIFDVECGTYTIKETVPLQIEGYTFEDVAFATDTISVIKNNDGIVPTRVTNYYTKNQPEETESTKPVVTPKPVEYSAYLLINKVDTQGNPVAGAGFTVTNGQTTQGSIGRTDAQGQLLMGLLDVGTFTITESTVPAGYVAGAPVTVNVTAANTRDNPCVVTIVNAKEGEQPTATPTDAPTETPSEQPTAAPTDAPSEQPSEEPTVSPTDAPTSRPTTAPTSEPGDEDVPKTGDNGLGYLYTLLGLSGLGMIALLLMYRKLRRN